MAAIGNKGMSSEVKEQHEDMKKVCWGCFFSPLESERR
jgi:hypothetical protein